MLTPRHLSRRASAGRRPQRGVAALSIVMVLFLIMAMVAAYTNRNLVFEQRTSANSYRAERALAAAEAGLDWTISMLNSGRLSASCTLDTSAADDFRARYLSVDTEGRISPRTGTSSSALYSGCVYVNGALTCTCPSAAASPAALGSSAEPPGSAFRIQFTSPGGAARPGAVSVFVQGCGTPGVSGALCVSPSGEPQVDGITRVAATLGLVRALPSAPIAALTAAGNVNASSGELRIANEDGQTGYTVYSGGTVSAGVTQYVVPAGAGGNGVVQADNGLAQKQLTTLANGGSASDTMFISTFGLDGPNYRRQQGVVRKACASACSTADLDYMVGLFPGRVLWFDGDLTLTAGTTLASGSLGTAAQPALVIVTGTLAINADNPMYGLFYGSAVSWSATGATVRGGVISASNFTSTGVTRITYDSDVIQRLVTSYGTFVRTPGSWTRRTTF